MIPSKNLGRKIPRRDLSLYRSLQLAWRLETWDTSLKTNSEKTLLWILELSPIVYPGALRGMYTAICYFLFVFRLLVIPFSVHSIAYVEFRTIELVERAIALTGTIVMGLPIMIQHTEAERNKTHAGDGQVSTITKSFDLLIFVQIVEASIFPQVPVVMELRMCFSTSHAIV